MRSGRVLDTVPLIVTGRGSCNHSERHHDVTPGTYEIFADCFTCDIAVFRVTNNSSHPPLASTGAPLACETAVGILLIALGAYFVRRSRRTASPTPYIVIMQEYALWHGLVHNHRASLMTAEGAANRTTGVCRQVECSREHSLCLSRPVAKNRS
jgi:hypothetical protein